MSLFPLEKVLIDQVNFLCKLFMKSGSKLAICKERKHCLHGSLSREPFLNKHVETSGNIFAKKGALSIMETRKCSSDQGTQRESSSQHSGQDSSSRSARSKNVFMWKDENHPNSHSEESPRIDPMIEEARIAERGGLGQVKDESSLPREMICEIFKRLDTSTFMTVYRSFDKGYKFLKILDAEKREKVIKELKTSELAEHFNALKTSNERKEFIGWLNDDQRRCLDQWFQFSPNKRKEFLRELNYSQFIKVHNACKDRAALYRSAPLEYLEKVVNQFDSDFNTIYNNKKESLGDLSISSIESLPRESLISRGLLDLVNTKRSLDAVRSVLLVRKNAEHFNTLKTDNDRKEFVRRLQLNEIRDVYLHFNDDTNKQREFCGCITIEDLESLAKAKAAEYLKEEGFRRIKNFYIGRDHWLSEQRINSLSQAYSLEELVHAFLCWDDPMQKEEFRAAITSKLPKSEDLETVLENYNIFRKELNSLYCVKRFNLLETYTERVKFLKDLPFNKSVSEREKGADKKEKGDHQASRKDEQRCAMP
jgi:hypothetical protein